jgi:hypothetical protein
VRIWLAVAVAFAVSAGLIAALTVWTDHTVAATHAQSHAFAQQAKAICAHAPHTVAGVERAAQQLAVLAEPPNVHRAVARLELHWRRIVRLTPGTKPFRAEVKEVRLSAHLLNITACMPVVPR